MDFDETEIARLAALRAYEVLDTTDDGSFDRICEVTARRFDVPVSLISLVDEDRIWFKAKYGVVAEQVDRELGLCASAIYSDDIYVARDAIQDSRTKFNSLVAGEMGFRFYAAAPLKTRDGHRLGTLNIVDFVPREFSPDDEASLALFGKIVMDQLEMRLTAIQTIRGLANVLGSASNPDELDRMVTLCAWTKRIRVGDDWLSFEDFLLRQLGLRVTHGLAPDALDQVKGMPPRVSKENRL